MKHLALLAVPTAALSLAAPASAVTFTAFTTVGSDANNQNPAVLTVDDLTLTANASRGLFRVIDTADGTFTGTGFGGETFFQRTTIQPFESVSISFDDQVTLDLLGILVQSQTAAGSFTITNGTSGDSFTASLPASGTNDPVSLSPALAADAGDVLTFSSTSTYRLGNVSATVVPEPASMALLAAGGTLLLSRRRA